MKSNAKKLSPVVFLLALFCFFLPFVTFSCQGQKVLSVSGIQLVTGSSVPQPQMFGPAIPQRMEGEPLAVLAFVCGILGLGLSFLRGRNGAIAGIASGGLGFLLLLAMKSKIEGDVLSKAGGVIQVSYDIGFAFVLILFFAAVAVNTFALIQSKAPPKTEAKPGGETRFCTRCGSKNLSSDSFCTECGAPLG